MINSKTYDEVYYKKWHRISLSLETVQESVETGTAIGVVLKCLFAENIKKHFKTLIILTFSKVIIFQLKE